MKKRMIAVLIAVFFAATVFCVEAKAGDEYVYCVGSVSKVYSTAAVMKLVDEGKVKLDDPVTAYVPDFELSDERYRDITVRMLMDHTSGMMGTTQLAAFCYEHGVTHDEMFLKLLSGQRLKADPGEYASYCNDSFDLLALIVENVTGMTYTDYIKNEVASVCNGRSTGTAADFETLGTLAPSITPGNLPMDFGVTEALGAGGIYSTAGDVASFGAAFFDGDTVLLSEDAKEEMAVRWDLGVDADPFKDENGLGWDYVRMPGFDEAGVQVLLKGGDAMNDHACLMVAPDEKVSIAVLSNGGSSTLNGMVADAIMQTVLEERGIKKVLKEDAAYELLSRIPDEYDEYEGFYSATDRGGSAVIAHVTFPGHRYMHVENIGALKTVCSDFMLCNDGEGHFVELAYELETDEAPVSADALADARPAADPMVISFVKDDRGGVFFTADYDEVCPGIGKRENRKYAGEMIREDSVEPGCLSAWEEVSKRSFLLCNDVPESAGYENGIVRVIPSKDVPGYGYFLMGNLGTRVLRFTDPQHAISFQTMPSSTNRDSVDLKLVHRGDADFLETSTGLEYISERDVPAFEKDRPLSSIREGRASWFRIGDEAADPAPVQRPDGSNVYVFDKYGSVIYNSHVKDASDDIPLVKGGYLVITKR